MADVRRRAVFLDRDGTICEEMGYLNHISRFRMFPYAPAAIRRLNEAGVPVIVVTNQSGIARRIFPESLVHQIHDKMKMELAAGSAHVEGIYFCPHRSDEACGCRKPFPGMLERAAREHNLELRGSFVVGDRYDDVTMAHRVGAAGVLVMTGYGRGEYELRHANWTGPAPMIAEDLTEAVELVLKELR